jgi:putative two-component system response regulator
MTRPGRSASHIPLRAGPIAARILVVDDDPVVRETIQDSLEHLGYRTRGATSAEDALEQIPGDPPDLILLDVRMPGITGIELCRQLKADQATRLIPVILLTAQGELDSRVAGLEAGADDYFTKPVHLRELAARVRSLLRLKRVVEELEQAENMIASMALTIEARDTYTAGHCVRLASFATELGERLGLSEEEIAALRLGGYLHDLGKIAIPDGILLKPGPLSPEEWRLMREHPLAGDRLARPMRTLGLVLPVIRHHHERVDGRGYPDRLVGAEIPLLARIMAVVDVYDALRTRRPYKLALEETESLQTLADSARSGQLDPDLVRPFAELRATAGRSA